MKVNKTTKILGYEEYENISIPIIECEYRKDFYHGLEFYCIYCKRIHRHGQGEGDRHAHCLNPKSPFHKTGYYLKLKEEKPKW